MIHKACMPVYMNSGKIVAGRVDGWTGNSKVLQEVLADLKICWSSFQSGGKRRFRGCLLRCFLGKLGIDRGGEF